MRYLLAALLLTPLPAFAFDADSDAAAAFAFAKAARERTPVVADIPVLPKATGRFDLVRVHAPGFHVHQCGACGAQWSHTEGSYGKRSDHMCPACGKGPWWNPVATNTNLEMREVKPAPARSAPYTPRTLYAPAYCPPGSSH